MQTMAKTATKTTSPAPKKGEPTEPFAPEFEAPDEKGVIEALKNEGMLKTSSDKVQRQPRTLGIPQPKMFFFEPAKPIRKDIEKGNEHNQISSGVHQVDPNRRVSCNPIMPNLQMLKDTGNPFPTSSDHKSVVTSKTWEPFVSFAHVLYGLLKAQSEPVIAKDLIEQVIKTSKVGGDSKGKPTSNARRAMVDMLRDLRLYGIVVADNHKHSFRTTKWALVEKPEKIEFTSTKS
jgi:hypothetical protein